MALAWVYVGRDWGCSVALTGDVPSAACPQPVDVVAIVAGVVATVVAVGLVALLIWRLFTFIHDTREVARFEKERRNAKWDTVSRRGDHRWSSFDLNLPLCTLTSFDISFYREFPGG